MENRDHNASEDQRIRNILLTDGKLVISIFIAGTGIVFWAYNVIFNPVKDLQKDIALMQQEIHTIESNHLTHLQKAVEDINARDEKQQQNLDDINIKLAEILTEIKKR